MNIAIKKATKKKERGKTAKLREKTSLEESATVAQLEGKARRQNILARRQKQEEGLNDGS